jgi:hypothetical protein
MASEIASNYKAVVNSISDIIQASGYRNDYIAQKIGLTPANFTLKKKRGTLSVNEVESILRIIENEDVEDFIMMEIMRARQDEPTITLEQLEKEMGW